MGKYNEKVHIAQILAPHGNTLTACEGTDGGFHNAGKHS
jgi:hypothetical protein